MELYNFFSSANGQASVNSKKDYADFPFSLDDVWILGKKYSAVHDLEDLRNTIRSKIWFSYRSGFPSIGGTGPKTDKYWGCMLRCGQMVMAEALLCRHLGREWKWLPGVLDPVYVEILRMFQDKKDCPYSIHQIAQMGASEGKGIGDWFGPNTIAQVLRKLSIYDEWSSLAVHIAFDNTVIKSDISKPFYGIYGSWYNSENNANPCRLPMELDGPILTNVDGENRKCSMKNFGSRLCKYHPEPLASSPFPKPRQTVWYAECDPHNCQRWQSLNTAFNIESDSSSYWRPMLLFIPLRLGLSSFNPVYSKSIQDFFKIKQNLGILGGKPRHAVWFIGYTGNELICLDPHVTQSTVNLDGNKFDDSSYHIPFGGSKRMSITDIDPSISLCFFIQSEEDFEDWYEQVQSLLLVPEKQHLFEVLPDRPKHWPPLEFRPDLNCSNCSLDYFFVEQENNGDISDEDFESIGSMAGFVNSEKL